MNASIYPALTFGELHSTVRFGLPRDTRTYALPGTAAKRPGQRVAAPTASRHVSASARSGVILS
jgi:hypothetical protein